MKASIIIVGLVLSATLTWATPSVTVSDQAVKDDTVTISQVTSDGPGWIVIHKEQGGGPGPVVGYAAVKSGSNSNVVVKIDSYTATPKLFAMLHTDKGVVGKYEFPGPDVPVMLNGEMVSPAFMVSDLDARVVVKDQKIAMSSVVIEEVLSNGPGWLVIHADSKGEPGPVIGWAAVKDGLTRNLSVKITASKATPTLYAMLHADKGVVGKYEFPGPDMPIIVDDKMVSPPFKAMK